jgi:hypothetical protein
MRKQLLYILLVAITATSCITQRKCNAKFPPQIIVKDSVVQIIKDSIIVKDSLITVKGETITYTEYIRDTLVFIDTIIKQGNVSLQLKANKGKLTAICKADSLQLLVQMLRRQLLTITHSKATQQTIVQPTPKPIAYIPKWVWYCLAISILTTAYIFRKPLITVLNKLA